MCVAQIRKSRQIRLIPRDTDMISAPRGKVFSTLCLFEAGIVLRLATVWELFCGSCLVFGAGLLLGCVFPKKASLVWGPEGLWELGWVPLISQAWNVASNLSHRCALPSTTRDCERQFVILSFIRPVPPKTKHWLLCSSLPPRNPPAAASPGSGERNVYSAFLSRIAVWVPAALPLEEQCLLILGNSGSLHSRAACQNTGQINMSLDYPLIVAKESITLTHKKYKQYLFPLLLFLPPVFCHEVILRCCLIMKIIQKR